jgi:hypothetical protein
MLHRRHYKPNGKNTLTRFVIVFSSENIQTISFVYNPMPTFAGIAFVSN